MLPAALIAILFSAVKWLRDGFNGAHVPQRSRSGGGEAANEEF